MDNVYDEKEVQDREIIKLHPSDAQDIIQVRNVHKTYLLGLEGVTALRGTSYSVKSIN